MKEVRVVKIGGKVIDDEQKLDAFLEDFVQLDGAKVLVHGGGKIASDVAQKLGLESKLIAGRRVTDQQMLDVVTMVYGGLVNKTIVAKLQALGCDALGLSGADLNIIKSKKRSETPINYGFVGDVEEVNGQMLMQLLYEGIIPVLAPLTHDGMGQMLNTNADNIAGFTAIELAKHISTDLELCFDLEAVMNGDKIITEMNMLLYRHLTGIEVIKDGMIPKLDLGFMALNSGVNNVRIVGFNNINNTNKGTRLIK